MLARANSNPDQLLSLDKHEKDANTCKKIHLVSACTNSSPDLVGILFALFHLSAKLQARE
jgi:hypothetical protein